MLKFQAENNFMIPVLNAEQIREADAYTIAHEPVDNIDLMERAAGRCYDYIAQRYDKQHCFTVFCGTGNNGGDGLVMARLLAQSGYNVRVFTIQTGAGSSDGFRVNLERAGVVCPVTRISAENDFPALDKNERVIDALFGTGLSRAPEGLVAELIEYINRHSFHTISIDLPSGLYADRSAAAHKKQIVNAKLTLTFQLPKLAFFLPENALYVGFFRVINIGLDLGFIASCKTRYHVTELNDLAGIIVPRNPFSHKGTYGHALVMGGSEGKTGAAVLSAMACLRAGAGLLTVKAPRCAHEALKAVLPEAMLEQEPGEFYITSGIEQERYDALGIGPGLGTHEETARVLKLLIQTFQGPMVIDADALNILSENKTWLSFLPAGCVLTPHPGEFERLFGKSSGDDERIELLVSSAVKFGVHIVLKGRYSLIATPGGNVFINTTGNPGMATGGSGDVLTGIITGLLAQGLTPLDACMAGVGIHGLAGDMALETQSEQSLIASDLVRHLGRAFREVEKFR